jgi:hypothetical protein
VLAPVSRDLGRVLAPVTGPAGSVVAPVIGSGSNGSGAGSSTTAPGSIVSLASIVPIISSAPQRAVFVPPTNESAPVAALPPGASLNPAGGLSVPASTLVAPSATTPAPRLTTTMSSKLADELAGGSHAPAAPDSPAPQAPAAPAGASGAGAGSSGGHFFFTFGILFLAAGLLLPGLLRRRREHTLGRPAPFLALSVSPD